MGKHDLAILQKAFQYQESIFTCNDWEVFSDVPAQISVERGYWSTVVSDPDGLFTKLHRKDKPDHFLNTPLFIQVWKALAQQKRATRQSFTVKVDPVTVFLPQRLRAYLAPKTGESDNGFYFQNCKSVQQGFFGNLEIVSKSAMKIFLNEPTSSQLHAGRRIRRDARSSGSLARGARISSCRTAWTSTVSANVTASTLLSAALAPRAGPRRRRKTPPTFLPAQAPTRALPSTPSGRQSHTSRASARSPARTTRRHPKL